jgi:hypothetical protein
MDRQMALRLMGVRLPKGYRDTSSALKSLYSNNKITQTQYDWCVEKADIIEGTERIAEYLAALGRFFR